MKSNHTISEKQQMLITVIISAIPRRTLKEFKDSISDLTPEEIKYLKQELSILIVKGQNQYLAAYNSL